MKLSVAVSLEFKDFAGATVTDKESGIINGYIDKSKGKPVLTQRPSINISEVATVARGRAIYYWDLTDVFYILNDDTIYKTTYASPIATTIASGIERCTFFQLNSLLVLMDVADNKGYTLDAADTLIQIGGFFPASLAHGGAILDGYFFVMDRNGVIWNSDLNDASTFSPGNSIDTEREEDSGIYLGKHHDHLLALGERTCEFFYDNGNPTNSPLNRREDVSYRIGCIDGNSIWEEGDITIFLGTELSSGISIYAVENFKIRIISNSPMDAMLTQALIRDKYRTVASGFTSQGHKFYFLTLYIESGDVQPEVTYVYDFQSGLWYNWTATIDGLMGFPVMDFTLRGGLSTTVGAGVFTNGDTFFVNHSYVPRDTIGASTYFVDGYIDDGYFTTISAVGVTYPMTVRLGQFDGDSNNNKFMTYLRPAMNKTATNNPIDFYWSDDNNDNFVFGGTIDPSYQFNNIQRCGRFFRRNIELRHESAEQVFIEAVEAKIKMGTV